MKMNEFKSWLNKSSYKKRERCEGYTVYEQGLYRTLYLHDDGKVDIYLISPVEYFHEVANVEDFEYGVANSVKVKIVLENEGHEKVEDEYYLYGR